MNLVSFFNPNIPLKVVQSQQSVFNKFGYEIEQVLTNLQHPEAIDDYLLNKEWNEIAIFDIDCIPLSKRSFTDIELLVKTPVLYGAAQKANHIPDSDIYVSPAFICFNRQLYDKLGKPSFKATGKGDVGSEVTYKAKEKKVPIIFLYPTDVEKPRWTLRENEMFGLGTTYTNKIYHAFESRMNHESTNMFIKKCEHVLST